MITDKKHLLSNLFRFKVSYKKQKGVHMQYPYPLEDHPVIKLFEQIGERPPYIRYRCPCCGEELEPEEMVYLGDEGIIGCTACICCAEAQDALGPDKAA